MGFRKFAHASIVKSDIELSDWGKSKLEALSSSETFDKRASSQVVLQKYDPSKYLLTHCTIIASVDTEDAKEGTGKFMLDGFEVNRKYKDYFITPKTIKFVNSNKDAWERKLLLSSFKTFIGGFNFQEHIQIPELSKGKIIDAAARDTGDSIYVDILVATERKHKSLIRAIRSGEMSTLSMGCFLPGSQVSMANGTRVAIEDVSPGDMVLTHKGRAREVQNKQIRVGNWGVKKIEAVGIPSTITATDIHPFFVLRPQTYCACGCGESLVHVKVNPVRRISKRFKTGHDKRIYNPNNTYSIDEARERKSAIKSIKEYKIEEVRADELSVGDYLCFPRIVSKENTSSDITTGKARLLGLFLAEGSFLKYKGDVTEVQFNFSLHEKDTLVAETVSLLKSEFGINAWVQDREDRTTCAVHAYGRELAKWFKQHGGEYSSTKCLSVESFSWSDDLHRSLVGGWLDGDGTRSVKKLKGDAQSLIGTTTSYSLACQMHAILAKVGINSRLACNYGGSSVEIREAVNGGVSMRHPDTKRLASFDLIIGARQIDSLTDTCNKAKGGRTPQTSHLRVLENYIIFPITSIESLRYEGPVYDMEVEEDHSYIVEGVAVHNCSVLFTQCSKCGNVAHDELELCHHIRYEKGKTFKDKNGVERIVAELCGHLEDEPGSVKFIEASWVGQPAFHGAVVRNIFNDSDFDHIGVAQKIQAAFTGPAKVIDPTGLNKAASLGVPAKVKNVIRSSKDVERLIEETRQVRRPIRYSTNMRFSDGQGTQQDFGLDEPNQLQDSQPEGNPFEKPTDEIYEALIERVVDKLKSDLGKNESQAILNENRSNDSLIHSSLNHPNQVISSVWRKRAAYIGKVIKDTKKAKLMLAGLVLYSQGGWEALKVANLFSGIDMLAVSRILDQMQKKASVAGESRLYQTVIAVGGTAKYLDVNDYLTACRQVIGRDLTNYEMVELVNKGKIFSFGF